MKDDYVASRLTQKEAKCGQVKIGANVIIFEFKTYRINRRTAERAQ